MDEDLIKKLEKIELPEMEIKGHREWLKTKLIDWKYFREKRGLKFLPFLKPAGIFLGSLSLILLAFLIINLKTSPMNLAQKIALEDPQVKEMIEKGAKIEDLKTFNDKAYLLISNESPALTEINLKERKISKFEKISLEDFPLTEREKEKAKEIAKVSPKIERGIGLPKFEAEELEVTEIKLAPPLKLKLVEEKNEIKVVPEEKRVLLFYKIGQERWVKKINITKGEVEEVKFLGRE